MTAWIALTRQPALQLVRIRDNSYGYADMSDGFLRLIVIDQAFEEDFFSIADAILVNGGTFFDVGANYGLLSFGLAGKYGAAIDFHLFEPNPKLVSAIKKTVEFYPKMRLTLNETAVSDKEGRVVFDIDEFQSGASHISDVGKGIDVDSVTLDRYMENCCLVHLLKLDIEGFELLALRGAKESFRGRKIQAVYFEYFEKWLRRVGPPSEVLNFFEAMEYEVCFCRPNDYAPRGGATCLLRGTGVPLLPVRGFGLPEMTDLMAAPKELIITL